MRNQRLAGNLSSFRVIAFLAFLALISLVLALLIFLHTNSQDSHNAAYKSRAAEVQSLSNRAALLGENSAKGNLNAYNDLEAVKNEIEALVWELRNGSTAKGLPPAPDEVSVPLGQLENAWSQFKGNLQTILGAKDVTLATADFTGVISETMPQTTTLTSDLVEVLVNKGDNNQVGAASELVRLLERIKANLGILLTQQEPAAGAYDQLGRDSDRLGSLFNGLVNGDNTLELIAVQDRIASQKLTELEPLYTTVQDNINELLELAPDILRSLEAEKGLDRLSQDNYQAATNLSAAYDKSPGLIRVLGISPGPIMIGFLVVLSAVFLVLMGVFMVVESRKREMASKQTNEDNQKAILRLLDEMGELADGDLTVTASVTEDITGAIADSINYAIEALRELVTTINQTSDQLSGATQESRATAMHLAEASEHQAEQITKATESIKAMTQAIDQMSSDATESAEVAKRSVDIANTGAETVKNTMQGMDSIREQIQETSKRIKRLGESSQEIGDIVELIDDIADQTNILALNAAMQAAMAGEAGRGFAVVADEVQRLAERSINATKQIEALVKTIQADTNEAVISMEASTTGVVKVANFAEEAGDALKEIEAVSGYISDQANRISESAKAQSEISKGVNEIMTVVQEITAQTSDGTKQTAVSIGDLADMSDELQKSVAGFRLPG